MFHLSASLCHHSLGMHFLSCSYFNSKCYNPVGNWFPQNISRMRLGKVTPWACTRSGLNLCQPETCCHANPPGKDWVTSRSPILSSTGEGNQVHPRLSCHISMAEQYDGPILKLWQILSDKRLSRTITIKKSTFGSKGLFSCVRIDNWR